MGREIVRDFIRLQKYIPKVREWKHVSNGLDFFLTEIPQIFNATFPRIAHVIAYGSEVWPQLPQRLTSKMTDYMVVPYLENANMEACSNWLADLRRMRPQDFGYSLSKISNGRLGGKILNGNMPILCNSRVMLKNEFAKYTIIIQEILEQDLKDWKPFFAAGRLHKPVRVFSFDRVSGQQLLDVIGENRIHALRVAAMLEPPLTSINALLSRICSLSYDGDLRQFGFDKRDKVERIFNGQWLQLLAIYAPLISRVSTIKTSRGFTDMLECLDKLRECKPGDGIYKELVRKIYHIIKESSQITIEYGQETRERNFNLLPKELVSVASDIARRWRLNRLLYPLSIISPLEPGTRILPWSQDCLSRAVQKLSRRASMHLAFSNLTSNGFFRSAAYIWAKLNRASISKVPNNQLI